MKNIFLAVLLFGCLVACTTKTPRIVENPPFVGWSSRTLELTKYLPGRRKLSTGKME